MKKLFKIAIQMDPLEKIDPKADSTYVIAKEAQKRGYKTFHYLPKNLTLKNNKVFAKGSFFKIINNKKKFYQKSKEQELELSNFNVVLVRQDPPFDMHYLTATYILEQLPKKVLVLNNPSHIRNNPEKISMFKFKNLIPETVISSNENEIIKFINKNNYTILKPLYGNGGEGIEKVKRKSSRNKSIIRKLLKKYHYPVVAQKFIKDIDKGDRRIILFDGEYMGSVARIPKSGSIKANFHAGGSPKKTGLVFRDKKICKTLSNFLKKNNLFFAGIDVIGNYLTEINVTSPTGIQEINKLNNVRLEEKFWNKIEKKLR